MSTLTYILLYTFIGSIGSLIGGVILLFWEQATVRISHFLASFAAGVLLAFAFFDLLPEAAEAAEGSGINIFSWTLIGILVFFLIERFIHWFHHHEQHHEHEREAKSTIPLIIIGDTVHNFIDGVIIAATFLVSIPLGIATTLAVTAHEVPQEIADFGLLLHKGLSKRNVIIVNLLSASAAFLGALMTYALGIEFLSSYIPIILSLTAGFFIYIATSDLIPEIQYERSRGYALVKTFILIGGAVLIWILFQFIAE